jgi:uracil-DNA glycosylase family 4
MTLYCTHNRLVLECRQCVPPEGKPDAKITIIGARPGPDEVEARRPFIGWSGDLLFRLLGVSRSSCYITNVRKDYSQHNSVPTQQEIEEVLPALQDELASTRSNIFICLGTQALFAVTGRTSIDLWRGSIIASTLVPERKCGATWHPAASARVYSHRYVIARDLRRFKREADYPDIRRPNRQYLIDPREDEALQFIGSLVGDITVDIETLEGRRCIAVTDSQYKALCIPINGGHLTNLELASVFRALDVLFRTHRVCGQNIQFDTGQLEDWGFTITEIGFDTMLAHHLLWTELGRPVVRKGGAEKGGVDDLTGKHSLDFISSIYCDNLPYYKDASDRAWGDPGLTVSERWHQYWDYNCTDADCTHEAKAGLKAELQKYGQEQYFEEHVLGLIRPVMAMERRGLRVDRPGVEAVARRARLEVEYLQCKLDHEVGFHCNVRSTTDMRHLVYDVLQYKVKKTTAKKAAPSVDKESIIEYSYKSPHSELFSTILDIRKRRTLLSGFLGLVPDADGRYRAHYLIHGTDSGRLSSRAKGKGPQLQNVPKKARIMFIAERGKVYLSGDYKRAEAMYVAYDSGDPYLMELFKDPAQDLYLSAAQDSLGLTTLSEAKPYRDCFKHVVLASNYLMGAAKLVIVLRTVPEVPIYIEDIPVRGVTQPLAKADYLLEKYHVRARQVKVWQRYIMEEVSRTRVLHDSHGRRRVFLGRLDKHTFGTACSYRPQASVVGLTNRALRVLHLEGAPIVAQTHDEVLLEVPFEEAEAWGSRLKHVMEYEIPVLGGRKLTIPVELTWGNTWGEMRPWNERPWGIRQGAVVS